jgi:methylmalonyl-CoA mutase C-terminal domain/subunit
VLLFGGGIIPDRDIEDLKKLGVGELFTPGTPTHVIINYVRGWVEQNRN